MQATSEIGGSDVAIHRLATRLDPRRYRPLVVLPRRGPLTPRLEVAGVDVVVVPMRQLRAVKDLRYQLGFVIGFLPTVIRLAQLFRERRVDIVHSKSLLSLYSPWAARLCRLPHVWQLGELPRLSPLVRRSVAALTLMLSRRVVPVSEAVATAFFGPAARRSPRVMVIPDGIELDNFSQKAVHKRLRETLSIPESVPLVGFVARLVPWKGPDVFLRVAAAVAREQPDAHFLVCGGELPGYEGYSDLLRRLAFELGLADRVHFLGWASPDDMPDVMASLDVLVHASVRPEPFGLVIVEALASATPVVAARAGGVSEIVEDGVSGILVTPGDWTAMGKAVVSLVRDPSRARSIGQAGRERASRLFGIATHVGAIEYLYDSL